MIYQNWSFDASLVLEVKVPVREGGSQKPLLRLAELSICSTITRTAAGNRPATPGYSMDSAHATNSHERRHVHMQQTRGGRKSGLQAPHLLPCVLLCPLPGVLEEDWLVVFKL